MLENGQKLEKIENAITYSSFFSVSRLSCYDLHNYFPLPLQNIVSAKYRLSKPTIS